MSVQDEEGKHKQGAPYNGARGSFAKSEKGGLF